MSRVGDQVFFLLTGHAWVLGTVTSIDSSSGLLSCKSTDSIRGVAGESASKLRDQVDVVPVLGSVVDDDVDDLLHLTILHDSTLLRCLYIRYMRDVIYTNIGAIVVALNPFTFTIPWYKDDQMPNYLAQGPTLSATVLPHTWGTAHTTFFELVADMSPQFILVSGESGSGKTEASKIVVKYLSMISLERGSPEEATRCKECGFKLQQCSPILEAFGNARTVRNDNSSRFGKFMKIQFSEKGVLSGAFIERYLLEKSRIISAAEGERLYHAFYLLLRGSMQKQLSLQQDSSYSSLSSGKMLKNSDYDTKEDWDSVVSAMHTVGLSEELITSVWRVPAGVISLLNVKIVADGDGSRIHPESKDFANKAAELWGVDPSVLCNELVQSVMVIRGENSLRLHSPASAVDCRDGLCKALYDKLFEWLVARCNALCDSGETAGWIGLLDIFGFEDFKVNSFEQLCINLANETLQGHYNTYVFVKDMEECALEGINTASITCPDNSPCLQLISDARTGIFSILDDQCSIGKGSDADFLSLCVSTYGGKHKDYVVDRTSKSACGVRHYAGTVKYETAGWVEKNRDNIKDGLRVCLRKSTDATIAGFLDPPLEADAPKKKAFVSTFFRQQLAKLMKIINESNPHWIRCIKPHPAKKPRMFHGELVLNQLESSGVLGTVKIRKAGYPVRIPFAKFVDRFCMLANDGGTMRKNREKLVAGPSDACRAACGVILAALSMNSMAVSQTGKTKIFLKAEAIGKLEQLRRDFYDLCAARIQRSCRGLTSRLATAKSAVIKAVDLITSEYKAYILRSAEARAERARRMALLKAQAAETSSALYSQYADILHALFAAATKDVSEQLLDQIDALDVAWRAETVLEEERSRRNLFTIVLFGFVLEAEDVERLSIERDYWEMRHYLLLHCRDTLLDDLLDEEEYERRKALRIERRMLYAHPDYFQTVRRGIYLELEHCADQLFAAFCREVNETVVIPWYGTLLFEVEYGMYDDSPIAERPYRAAIVEEELRQRNLIKKFEGVVQVRIEVLLVVNEEIRERSFIVRAERRWSQEMFELAFVEHNNLFTKEGSSGIVAREHHVRNEMVSVERSARDFLGQSREASRCIVECSMLELDELKLRRSIWQNQHFSFELLTDGSENVNPRDMPLAMSVMTQERELRDRLDSVWHRKLLTIVHSSTDQFVVLRQELALRRALFIMHCLQHAELRRRSEITRFEDSLWCGMVAAASRALRTTRETLWQHQAEKEQADRFVLAKQVHDERLRRLVSPSPSRSVGGRPLESAEESPIQVFLRLQDEFTRRHGQIQHEANRSVWRSLSPEH